VAITSPTPPVAAPSEELIALHVAALRVVDVANSVGYLARRYADKLDEVERAQRADIERDLREVGASLTRKAEAAR
jgi:hypothetical protein